MIQSQSGLIRTPLSLALALAVALFAHAGAAPAQSINGRLGGTVRDQNGAALPGVRVAARHAGTGLARQTTTDGEGNWSFPSLPVGAYEVSYELQGFKTLKRSGVEVEAAVPRTLEDVLEVAGVVGEVVTVTEGAQLATPETAAVSRQLSAEQLVNVPTPPRPTRSSVSPRRVSASWTSAAT